MEKKDPFEAQKVRFQNPDFERIFGKMLMDYSNAALIFEKQDIHNTIVFFGSAQIVSIEDMATSVDLLAKNFRKGELFKDRFEALEKQSSRIHMSRYYHAAEELAYRLANWTKRYKKPANQFYLCSGGGPGIMEATNRGAHRAGCSSIGLNIELPKEQPGNPYLSPEFTFYFHYFVFRKFWFFYFSRALVAFPGGLGTLDEIFEILNLIRARKFPRDIPLVLFGEEYWKEILNFEPLIRHGTIDREDISFLHYTDDVEEAYSYITSKLEKHYIEEE